MGAKVLFWQPGRLHAPPACGMATAGLCQAGQGLLPALGCSGCRGTGVGCPAPLAHCKASLPSGQPSKGRHLQVSKNEGEDSHGPDQLEDEGQGGGRGMLLHMPCLQGLDDAVLLVEDRLPGTRPHARAPQAVLYGVQGPKSTSSASLGSVRKRASRLGLTPTWQASSSM